MKSIPVHIIGGGLAGSEAAYFLAKRGVRVFIHEMRPQKTTAAHTTDLFAELVCSNSLKSKAPSSAPGMLKAELMSAGSLILEAATGAAVPAGEALAVDRNIFSETITKTLRSHPNITCINNEEVSAPFKDAITLIASGPLTSQGLSLWLEKTCARLTDLSSLYFYDAIAPIIDAATVDSSRSFVANRYDKGGEQAYINCPLNEEEYYQFVAELIAAEKVPPRAFEKEIFFQGCQPIEAIAASGRDSLRFGPMKPVGLLDPSTKERPYAVVQLRAENAAKTAYNLVGFQTKLKYGEQTRVFRKIPALRNAEFLRLGSIHRNTYVCAPDVLRPDLSLKGHPTVYLGGQITGVEGYLESTASGLLAAIFILQRLRGLPHDPPPANCAIGALLRHVTMGNPDRYQPSNIHFGLFDLNLFDSITHLKHDEARGAMAKQALENFLKWAHF